VYEEYYGLVEPPFSLTPDPKYLFRSESHNRAFQLLQYGIYRREGFMVLYGDIGTGKTTLCRAVLDTVDRDTSTALLFNPFLSETDLLRAILQDFGIPAPRSAAPLSKQELIDRLNVFLLERCLHGGRAIVLIDEAQNLPQAALEQIRILSNLETSKEKLLQIVLIGQLDLMDLLAKPELRQLEQRISIKCELSPLTKTETADYLRHRLAIAGGIQSRVSFNPDGIAAIYEYTGGVPRLINLLADRSLLAGMAMESNRIAAKAVHGAAETLQLRKTPARTPSGPLRRAARAMLGGVRGVF
jgi:general secretion pathway protein A